MSLEQVEQGAGEKLELGEFGVCFFFKLGLGGF